MVSLAKRLFLFVSSLGFLLILWPGSSSFLRAQLSTGDHLAEPGFWPTQNAPRRDEFVGVSACSSCHSAIVATQSRTPMGATAMLASDSDVLRSHPTLNFAFDKYRYEIKTSSTQNIYRVADGSRVLTENLLWAFGTDRVGQSYLFKRDDGRFYEARVTYFNSLKGLHFTPDRALASAKDLEEAMYRPVDISEIRRCFACHTTAANIADKFDEKGLIPGVTCEACHGPGAKHVAAMQAAKIAGVNPSPEGTIFNAAELSPADSVDFCGACHATWWDVKLSGVKGVSNAKSQPYRLEGSKCWVKGDARLSCIACHDPHKQLQTDSASYDTNCLSCHLATTSTPKSADHPGAPCPVSTKNCASCHMPKVYVPEMHYNFTDHRIRIARANEPYPE
jgi:cytochrome c554/c'-like protein